MKERTPYRRVVISEFGRFYRAKKAQELPSRPKTHTRNKGLFTDKP